MTIQYPTRIADQHVFKSFRDVIDAINQLQETANAHTSQISTIPTTTIVDIQQALQLGGSNPLNLTGLQGITGTAQAAVLSGTHATRLITTPVAGTFFYETDRFALYIGTSAPAVWKWVTGIMATTVAGVPVDLGVNDVGFTVWITLQNHKFRFVNPGWQFLDSEGGYIANRVAAPTGLGWQLCDGTATDYLQLSGASIVATAFTTPDETTANPGTYHTSAAAYTGTINAAVAPGISGTTDTEASHTHSVTIANTIDVTTIVGTFDAAAAQTVTSGAGTAHSHGVGSLVVDATGKPKNLGVLRYFRR